MPTRFSPLTVLTSLALLTACADQPPAQRSSPPAPTITLDGDLSDWPPGVAALADGDFVYIRTSLDGPLRTLQGMQDRSLALWIDADSSASTGAREPSPRAAANLGVDLEIRFSPLTDGRIGDGTAVAVPIAGGERVRLGHADIGLMFLPTYAAEEFEIRLSRHGTVVPGGLAGGPLAREGRATMMFVLFDGAGKVKGWSDPFAVTLPPRSPAPPRADATIPACAPGHVRVMSWNVLHAGPLKNSEPFARVIRAVDPDIIAFQEWDEGDSQVIQEWLNAHVGGRAGAPAQWTVVRGSGQGVAIASRHAMRPLGPGRIVLDSGESTRPVRFVAALVSAPEGQVAVGSTHLKCCGSADSDEDRRRYAEASAINSAMRRALEGAAGATGLRIIAGDMNLVGSRPPLDALRAGLDADGSDMEPARAMVLGDRAMYTWSDAKNKFSPGRLDWALVADSSTQVANAFVVDLSIIGDSALARMGLERTDTSVSDHLPVVIDLRAR